MSRDYKHQLSRKRRRDTAPGWVWLLAGLAIGLFVALLIYIAALSPRQTPAEPAAERESPVPQKAPEEPAQSGPRFDFYTILPEMEVMVPEQQITGKPRKGVRQVERPGVYLLQAGSFRTFAQADQLKAQLALLGLEAEIQTVSINQRETWHRVRLGPYKKLAQLNGIRGRLREIGIDTILLKVRE